MMTFFHFALGCLIGYGGYKVVCLVDKIMNTIERINMFLDQKLDLSRKVLDKIETYEKRAEEIFTAGVHFAVDTLLNEYTNEIVEWKKELVTNVPSILHKKEEISKKTEYEIVDDVK
jgi:hypothetical protein